MDHTTHTADELRARLAEVQGEHTQYASLHGTHVPAEGRSPTLAGPQTYNYSRALHELSGEIKALTYEVACADALARMPIKIGQRVTFTRPFIGRDGSGNERFGHDEISGRVGVVRRVTPHQDVIADVFGQETFVHVSRCEPA